MARSAPSDTQPRLMVRITDAIRDRLARAAEIGGRSLSAEIMLRLEASFSSDDAAEEAKAQVEEHEQRIHDLERDVERLMDRLNFHRDFK